MRVELHKYGFLRQYILSTMNENGLDGQELVLMGIRAYSRTNGELGHLVLTCFYKEGIIQFQQAIDPFDKAYGVEMEERDVVRLVYRVSEGLS